MIFPSVSLASCIQKGTRIRFPFNPRMLSLFPATRRQLPLLMATGIETLVVVWRHHPWYGPRMRAVATHPVHPLRDCLSTRRQAHFLWSSLFLGWAMFRGLQRPERISQTEASAAVVSMAPWHSLASVLLGLAWHWDLDTLHNLVLHCWFSFFFLFLLFDPEECKMCQTWWKLICAFLFLI